MKLDPKTIWQVKQNKPTMIVKDLVPWIDQNVPFSTARHIIYYALLKRGVFKWFTVRRKLIRLKDVWKKRIKFSLQAQGLVQGPQVNYWRGYRKALEECRSEIRMLCHSNRWIAPDNDEKAMEWLKKQTP